MARPRKVKQEEVKDELDSKKYGRYTLTKPHDHYVIKLGGSVVFASRSEAEAEKYIELLTRK